MFSSFHQNGYENRAKILVGSFTEVVAGTSPSSQDLSCPLPRDDLLDLFILSITFIRFSLPIYENNFRFWYAFGEKSVGHSCYFSCSFWRSSKQKVSNGLGMKFSHLE